MYAFKDTDPANKDVNGVSRWEKTNHAVLCVGWGEETTAGGRTQKYWVIKNSWGASWGEGPLPPPPPPVPPPHRPCLTPPPPTCADGYFRLARGNDEVAVESMSVAFDIEVPQTGLRAAATPPAGGQQQGKAPAPAASSAVSGDDAGKLHDHMEQATASLGGAHDTTAQLMSVGSGGHGRLPHRA